LVDVGANGGFDLGRIILRQRAELPEEIAFGGDDVECGTAANLADVVSNPTRRSIISMGL
jgi:hypothetical protein